MKYILATLLSLSLVLANDRPELTTIEYTPRSGAEIGTVGFAIDVLDLLGSGQFDPATSVMNVSGTFSDWGLIPMELAPDSLGINYFTLLDVDYGIHEYKYVISYPDGSTWWEEDINRVLNVDVPYLLLPVTTFNHDGENNELDSVLVSFQVDMSLISDEGLFDLDQDMVHVAGGFGNWSTPELLLTPDSTGYIYTGSMLFEPGYYSYRYRIQYSDGSVLEETGFERSIYAFGEDLTLPLESFTYREGGPLTITVLDEYTGGTVENALIELMPLDNGSGMFITALTDSSGMVYLEDILPVPYMLTINAADYHPYTDIIDFPQQTEVVVVLSPAINAGGGGISGLVLVDSTLNPVMGGLVAAVSMDNNAFYTASLNMDGSYHLSLPPNLYFVVALGLVGDLLDPDDLGVHYEFYENAYDISLATPVLVEADQMTSGIDFIFPASPENVAGAGNMVMGTISHVQGSPVTGTEMRLLNDEDEIIHVTTVQADGNFSFSGLAQSEQYRVEAFHEDYGEVSTEMESQNLIDIAELEFSATQLDTDVLPRRARLDIHPNPFNPSTTIRFQVPDSESARLVIYDVLGHVIYEYAELDGTRGNDAFVWDAHDQGGNPVSTGIYFVELVTETSHLVAKMLYLK